MRDIWRRAKVKTSVLCGNIFAILMVSGRISVFLFVLLWFVALNAQPAARIYFDTTIVETGDPFVLTIEAPELPQSLDFNGWAGLLPDSNCVYSSQWEADYERHLWYQARTYVYFDSAYLQLPPVTIQYKNASLETTNSVSILVVPAPSPNDVNDMAGIKDIHREPFSLGALLWAFRYFVLAALIGLLMFALLVYLIRQNGKKQSNVPLRPPLSARERALQRLDTLEKQQLWQQNQIKKYYDELTHIARLYVQEQYGIRTMERTTSEALTEGRKAGLPDPTLHTLETLLNWGDLAKFARQTPPEDFHTAALTELKRVISDE